MHPSRCCHFETKISNYNMFRTPKVQLLRICSSVLLNLFSSNCEPRIFGSLERKSGGNNSRTSTLSWLCMDINPFLFFFGAFATYCSSLLGLRCNIFFVIYFLFPAGIFAYIPLTNKYLLHVFRFSTNLPKKALKKPVKWQPIKIQKPFQSLLTFSHRAGEKNILHCFVVIFSVFISSMPSKVIIIITVFMFLGLNIFRTLLRAHFS